MTSTVRVSLRLAEVLDAECHRRTSAIIAPWLEPWIAEGFRLLAFEICQLQAEGIPQVQRKRPPARAATTIRLPLSQLRRLGIIAEVRDRWVGELVEEKLWEWVRLYGTSELARAALSERDCGKLESGPGERVLAGAGDGR